ncbi:MAG: DUF2974 domain-containing protein [Pseudobutyrivibrio sp.]|nr:DUF2974 domain-containing protein [Pseudobutyrivibrio sp.]
MANLEDYLDWRADIPFSQDPFNEVDGLLLCEITYTPFDGIVPGPTIKNKITIEEACEALFNKYSEEQLRARKATTVDAPFLLKKMIGSKRFGGTRLCGFVNEIDPENQSQFSVCTYYLNDSSIFVCFKGTDDSLVGWKEDFNMCFSKGTAGQLKARDYLNENFANTMLPLRIGGHSKGGNFAVYSSTFALPHIKDSILNIYSYDGPGFIKEIIDTAEYKSILDRINGFLPKESVFGMMMFNSFKSKVVVSDAKGVNQHNPLSWQIERNVIKDGYELDSYALLVDDIMKNWAKDFNYESRALFGDILYSALSQAGATKFSQVTSSKIKSVATITKEIQGLPPEQQKIMYDIIAKLLSTSGGSLRDSVISKVTDILNFRKNEKKLEFERK